MATNFEKRLAAIDRLTPREGFNVVAVDDYEEAGDDLYLVGQYKTKEDAESHAANHTKETGEKAYVYEPRK